MKTASACFGAVLLAVSALPAQAIPAPTQAQKDQVENCKILSGAVFQFAEARDKKLSKMDAFKNVTHGQNYVPGSLLDETLQWAYAHPDEQPDTASGHFYDRCVLDAYDARNPDTEGALDIAAAACQQGHPGAPDAIRDCIDAKTQDLIANPQSAIAAATSPATPAAATVAAAAPTPSPASVVAAATASPVAASEPMLLPAPVVETPTPVTGSHAVASAPVASVTAPAAPLPRTEVTAAAPAVSVPTPLVAEAQPPQAPPQGVLPLTPPPTVAAPAVSVPEPVVAEAHAQAPQAVTPVSAPPLPAPATPPPLPPAPIPAKAPAPVVAQVAMPQSIVPAAPLPPSRGTPAGGFPANLTGFGKLTVGMPMEDAYKALQSHGDTDYDADGEVHTYMIGDDHGFMELRPSATGTLYSIRVVGGADAHQAPILNVTLGDAAFILINAVGLPSSRTPLPGDKELWNYRDRNYAFEISPGGDVIGVRIIDTSYAPSAVTGVGATP